MKTNQMDFCRCKGVQVMSHEDLQFASAVKVLKKGFVIIFKNLGTFRHGQRFYFIFFTSIMGEDK
jgi:hypothetical protein